MSTIAELLKTAQVEADTAARAEAQRIADAELLRFRTARANLIRRMQSVLGVVVPELDVKWAAGVERHPEIAYVDLEGLRFACQVRGPRSEWTGAGMSDEDYVMGMLVCEHGHYRHIAGRREDYTTIGDGGKSVTESLLGYKRELDEFRASCKQCAKDGRISTLVQELYDEMGSSKAALTVVGVLLRHVFEDSRVAALKEAIDAIAGKDGRW